MLKKSSAEDEGRRLEREVNTLTEDCDQAAEALDAAKSKHDKLVKEFKECKQ